MANFGMNIPQDFIKIFTDLADPALAEKIVDAGGEIVEKSVIKEASKHKVTGSMVNSIKKSKAKTNENGTFTVVKASGKDSKGIRNMEKMAVLEYGAFDKRHHQPATPVLAPAIKSCEEKALKKMQEKYEELTGI